MRSQIRGGLIVFEHFMLGVSIDFTYLRGCMDSVLEIARGAVESKSACLTVNRA